MSIKKTFNKKIVNEIYKTKENKEDDTEITLRPQNLEEYI